MTRILVLSALAAAAAGCTIEMKVAPQVPPPNNAPKIPIKVAVVVPPSTRQITRVEELQNPCIGFTLGQSPEGDVFARTVEGVLRNYFREVVSLSAPPASGGAEIVVEAVMTRVGIKPACGVSPDMYALAEGSFRALGRDGREVWKSGRSSARAEGPNFDWGNYATLTPKAMAALATGWADDLAVSPLVRGERDARPSESFDGDSPAPAAAGGEQKPWWAK